MNERKIDQTKRRGVRGILSLMPAGFGFVSLIDSDIGDVFIPKSEVYQAMDGDEVLVLIKSMRGKRGQGPEGSIVEILNRKRNRVLGIVVNILPKTVQVRTSIGGLTHNLFIRVEERVKIGDRLLLKIKKGGIKDFECEFIETIGSIYEPKYDSFALKEEFQLPHAFSEEAIQESLSIPKEVLPSDFLNRRDLSDIPTITIDPKTARDFDDALSVYRTEKGFQLFVHIADVSHYVKRGSAIDKEACERKNSVYLLGECIPMLPPLLADEICSLKEGDQKLTVTVELQILESGKIEECQIYRSIIRSDKRFTYEEAFEVLEQKENPFQPLLKLLVELALCLKKEKKARGAIDLTLPEQRWELGSEGIPTGFAFVEYDITHQLVEECMLKANEVVAKELESRGLTLPYRIHEAPKLETLEEFYEQLRAFHLIDQNKPSQAQIQSVFESIHGTPLGMDLSVRYIRSMQLALYSHKNIGHYGLQIDHYTHFTSPIRRYADLITHRLLFEESYSEAEIQQLTKECSLRERLSMRAEANFLHLKKLRYLQQQQNQGELLEYPAILTKIRSYAIFFDIPTLGLNGSLHVSKLGNDYFQFYEEKEVLVGKGSSQKFEVGNWIKLKLERVDLLFLTIEWSLIESSK